ncbi:MAG: N-acyl homoserine lactonase family protein [Amaricoccus sp.]|uniref:N-acyl homoserine lactonase family protein n=1 Tax=Amaricoccus sp. TaxID=1872485 RepID=UPI0039E4A24A
MPKLRMLTVDTGRCRVPKAHMYEMAEGMIDIPSPVNIIEHHKHGLILFDTGLNHAISDSELSVERYGLDLHSAFGASRVTRDDAIDRQLEKFGYKCSDVKYVVYSHLHVDHAGGMTYFPDACHVVQHDEIRYAHWPERWTRFAYYPGDVSIARNLDILEVDGDVDLFEDGSMKLIKTPGHAPGHQMLLLDFENRGRVCLGADVAHTIEAFSLAAPMPFDHDLTANERSHMIVKRLKNAGIPVYFAHEMAHFDELSKDGVYWD